jgi:hypothetical protein
VSTPSPWSALKVLAGLGGALLSALVLWNLATLGGSPQEYFLLFVLVVPLGTAAAMCWWFVVRGHIPESRAVMAAGCLGGLVVGGAGFVVGFAGPLILQPEANQGPLLGILITGPLGAVVGTLIGLVVRSYWLRRMPPHDSDAAD